MYTNITLLALNVLYRSRRCVFHASRNSQGEAFVIVVIVIIVAVFVIVIIVIIVIIVVIVVIIVIIFVVVAVVFGVVDLQYDH